MMDDILDFSDPKLNIMHDIMPTLLLINKSIGDKEYTNYDIYFTNKNKKVCNVITYMPRSKLTSPMFTNVTKHQMKSNVLMYPVIGRMKIFINNIEMIERAIALKLDIPYVSSINDNKLCICIQSTTPYNGEVINGLIRYPFDIYDMSHNIIPPRPLDSGVDISAFIKLSVYVHENELKFRWVLTQLKVYEDDLFNKYMFNSFDHEDVVMPHKPKDGDECIFCKNKISKSTSIQVVSAVNIICARLNIDKPKTVKHTDILKLD